MVRGDVIVLWSSGGDFSYATETCMVNDHATLTTPHTGDPALASGEGYFYLVRAVCGIQNLGYETFADSQHDWRDPLIAGSGNDCP